MSVVAKPNTAILYASEHPCSSVPVRIEDDSEVSKYDRIYNNRATPYGHENVGLNAYPLFDGVESILDVGCGWNEFAQHMRTRGVDAVGVDFSCPGADHKYTIFDLPYEEDRFEWVTAFDVLEHLKPEMVDVALQEMMRVSKKFCFSIASFPCQNLHMTIEPLEWWESYIAPYAETRRFSEAHGANKNPYLFGEWFRDVGEIPAFLTNRRRAAVLCPGPSLPVFGEHDNGQYDIVIGVNRAAMAYRCDVWCMLDRHTYEWVRPTLKGEPVLLTTGSCWSILRREQLIKGHRTWHRGHLLNEFDWRHNSWMGWSSAIAVVAAAVSGAKEIDIYGMDMAGSSDWDGIKKDKQSRTDGRWKGERDRVGALFDELNRRGIKARRILGGQQNG